MKIAVIGTGYVGLVSGACFAELGFHVTCIDKDAHKIERLKKGEIPIYEPGLAEIVTKNAGAGRLVFSSVVSPVREADVIFIAVGTPARADNGNADISYVIAAAEEVGRAVTKPTIIVTKSTVPVGTGRKVADAVRHSNPDIACSIVSNPEFLREGMAIKDFMNPDRIVIGAETPHAEAVMQKIYAPLTARGIPLVMMGIESAELTKYAANALLATKIAFINEMADIAEKTGADVQDVALGMGLDKRIGRAFLQAGPGYGGSCFPKDTQALIHIARDAGGRSFIAEAVDASNAARKIRMAQKIVKSCGGTVKGKTIAILGLAFKADTDDMREAASLAIIPALLEAGAEIHAYDPQAMEEARKVLPPQVQYFDDPYSAMENADAAVILTEWDHFKTLDLAKMKRLLKTPLLIDLRNLYNPQTVAQQGITYISVGR